MSDNRSGFWTGLFLGGVIGAVAGVLAAPRPGRETRRLLKKSADALPEIAEDFSSSVQYQADRLSESAKGQWQGTLERLREAVNVGVEVGAQQRRELKQRDLNTSHESGAPLPDADLPSEPPPSESL